MKYSAPRLRKNLVPRKSLLKILTQSITDDIPGILLSAPAGYGKTTLIRQWSEMSENTQTAWVSLNEGDRDPSVFLSSIIEALSVIDSSLGIQTRNLLERGGDREVDTVLPMFQRDIERISRKLLIVLDDYHRVSGSTTDRVLGLLIGGMPTNGHLIVCSRRAPNLPLPRMRAQNLILELGTAQLSFDRREVDQFFSISMNMTIPDPIKDQLFNRTEGWPAGLQLWALTKSRGLSERSANAVPPDVGEVTTDYLFSEVLERLEPVQRDFLIDSSILEVLDADLCDAVIDSPDSSLNTLRFMAQANLFISAVNARNRIFRFHGLFRELLLSEFKARRSIEEQRILHRRAARWLEDSQRIPEAVRHYYEAGDQGDVARIAEKSWADMDDRLESRKWLEMLAPLGATAFANRPILCAQKGWALMDLSKTRESEVWLDRAEVISGSPECDWVVVAEELLPSLSGRIAAGRGYNAMVEGRAEAAIRYTRLALELLPMNLSLFRSQVSTTLSSAYWHMGNYEKALEYVVRFIADADQNDLPVLALMSRSGLADILMARGDNQRAEQLLLEALRLADNHHLRQLTAHHQASLALLYLESGDTPRSKAYREEAEKLGKDSGIIDWPYRRELLKARFLSAEGLYAEAGNHLECARDFLVRTPQPDIRPIACELMRNRLIRRDYDAVSKLLPSMRVVLGEFPDYPRFRCYRTMITAIIVHPAFSSDKQTLLRAVEILTDMFERGESAGMLLDQIETAWVLAAAYAALSNREKSRQWAGISLKRGAEVGLYMYFVENHLIHPEILSRLSPGDANTVFVRSILSAAEILDDTGRSSRRSELSKREVEVLDLISRGLSNEEIAKRLFISVHTVKGHNLKAFAKLGASNRTEAVSLARKAGII
jgi:LuxR family maltose regulon positive regulatory protein